MTWSPWNGLTVNRPRVFLSGEVEQSILAVHEVNIRPYWRSLLQGKLRLREITVNEPHVELSLEMLSALPGESEVIEPPPVPPPRLRLQLVKHSRFLPSQELRLV